MKLISMAFCLAAACSAGVGARAEQMETKSKVKVKEGKEVTVTGCVKPNASGTGYMLTNVADKSGALHDYMLAPDGQDLAKHVGHRVQLTGKVTDRGDGKIEVETKTKTKVEHGEDRKTENKTEMKGDMHGVRYLSVESLKMIAASCP
jgi:hypothetical protein